MDEEKSVTEKIKEWEIISANERDKESGGNELHSKEADDSDTETENEEYHDTSESLRITEGGTLVATGNETKPTKQDVVTFEETSEALLIKWAGIDNVDRYELMCKRTFIDEDIPRNVQTPECELKTDTYGWNIGEDIYFNIKAVDKQSKKTNVCTAVHHVIGGDKVPHGLQLRYNGDLSYKSLVLEWLEPKICPQQYEVAVYQKIESAGKLIKTLHTESLKITVNDLRPMTETYCIVKCKYLDGDGKAARSKPLKTKEIPQELHNAKGISVWKDPCNGVRQITVTWLKPERADIDHYEVHLEYGHNQKTKMHSIGSKEQKMANFQSLKSDTEYKACIVTVYENRKSSKAYSEVIRTDKAEKLPGFDITEKGKPIIKTCKVENDGNIIYGMLEWSLPDLGEERNNYQQAVDSVSLKESGENKVALKLVDGQHRAEKVTLKRGKSYSFTVTCSYLEFDSGATHEAFETQTLSTEIGKPSIDEIDWHGKSVTVAWTKANGAKRHTLKIEYKEKEGFQEVVAKDAKNTPITTKLKDYRHGHICRVSVGAHDTTGHTETTMIDTVLGGDEAVTDVVASNDERNPRRAIFVTWKSPKQKPQGYRVILYDVDAGDKGMKDEVNPLEQSQESHRFIDLKTETNYCIKVCPIYNGSASEGTSSNPIKTKKRLPTTTINQVNFGKPTNVMHAITDRTTANTNISLSWNAVQMGENYKVIGYQVHVYQKGMFRNTNVSTQNVGASTNRVDLVLKHGQKYDVTIKTKYLDLDKTKNEDKHTDYEILTDPSKTTVEDCSWRGGVFNFSWQPVAGATKYQLVIKDEFSKKDLLSPPKEVNTCCAEITANEELRIGQTCMTKVISYSEGGRTSESDWKAHLLGGNTVPRNVLASRYAENPMRGVNLTFGAPAQGPSSMYKIFIQPAHGMTRTEFCQTNTVVIEHLRKGISYRFEVSAKWGESWSEGSPSNSIQTEGVSGKGTAFMDFKQSQQPSVDLRQAIVAGHNMEVNMNLGEDFGKVKDLRPKLLPGHDKDSLQLQWNIPSFDNKSDDFKVVNYEIEIWKGQNATGKGQIVEFDKTKDFYESKKFQLDLGQRYEVAVATVYLDIDQDCLYRSSSCACTVYTRPEKPTCTRNTHVNENMLLVEWNAAKGAKSYQIEIYVDDLEKPKFVKDMHTETVYRKELDETFGFGSTYHVKITAFGAEGMSNFDETQKQIIGGERVPRNAKATCNHLRVHDPNSQVFLQWTAPQSSTKCYDISSIPHVDTMEVGTIENEECIVSGLKAGTEYIFKVKAIHEENGRKKTSGGCLSNKILTNPTPTQVKNVTHRPGKNPSISVKVMWDKVEAEKKDEMTKYRVVLWKADETTKREEIVEREEIDLYNLESGSTYYVTVAGGNSIGYGRNSEKIRIQTELGTPKSVILENNKKNSSSAMILTYQSAEGQALKYIAMLYKYTGKISQEIGDPTEVKPGHCFNDLEPNTEYRITLQAIFHNGEGKTVISNYLLTAPSKAQITKADCSILEGKKSSREIIVTWRSDHGCNHHEILIMRGSTQTIETQLLVHNKNKFQYLCLYEATDYAVRVRSQNSSDCFGDWSNVKFITLGKLLSSRPRGLQAMAHLVKSTS